MMDEAQKAPLVSASWKHRKRHPSRCFRPNFTRANTVRCIRWDPKECNLECIVERLKTATCCRAAKKNHKITEFVEVFRWILLKTAVLADKFCLYKIESKISRRKNLPKRPIRSSRSPTIVQTGYSLDEGHLFPGNGGNCFLRDCQTSYLLYAMFSREFRWLVSCWLSGENSTITLPWKQKRTLITKFSYWWLQKKVGSFKQV